MRKDRWAFTPLGVGLGAALGGILAWSLANRKKKEPALVPQLGAWERTLAKRFGVQSAALLAAQVQARYEGLFSERPRFRHPALRDHLEANILPGIALYRVLQEAMGPADDALAVLDECFTAQLLTSRMGQQARILDRLPAAFAVLRFANRMILRNRFPKEGWVIDWVEDSPCRVAYNITGCFYLNMLRLYGVPELTAHFCAGDDLLYGKMNSISWERTETLGRGDSRCDFAFSPRPLCLETEDA